MPRHRPVTEIREERMAPAIARGTGTDMPEFVRVCYPEF